MKNIFGSKNTFAIEYEKEDKQYFLFLIICSLLTMIGTAWIVNRPERKDILYLRYVEMYLPILFVYCFIQNKDLLFV